MMYKFKSKAAGDLIMLGPNGDAMLRALSREPAAQGIIEPAAMDAAIAALERAIHEEEALRAKVEQQAHAKGETVPTHEGVTSRQRLWPMIEMLRRARAANEPIVWGV
jgi:hypothetical protein